MVLFDNCIFKSHILYNIMLSPFSQKNNILRIFTIDICNYAFHCQFHWSAGQLCNASFQNFDIIWKVCTTKVTNLFCIYDSFPVLCEVLVLPDLHLPLQRKRRRSPAVTEAGKSYCFIFILICRLRRSKLASLCLL